MNLKPKFLNIVNESTRVSYDDGHAINSLATKLLSSLPQKIQQPIVFVCIGTDRSTGDSLGPLVGSKLEEKNLTHFHVYGTLEDPIHAVNLKDKLIEINNAYRNPFIIGIDACLGKLNSVGYISIGDGPVKPGAGVNKELPAVGDIHMTGIVNVSGFMEFFVLQNTRLHIVMSMAKTIATAINEAHNQYSLKELSSRFLR
ncbi:MULTISPECIES: spore protease YyaC [Bacillaceae]|uniref:spore protease YyaC n=1 Tax=Bacillaceae TaxID=186817 RepID=UPI002A0E3401|nr:spore protease YyaC [Cytobacillus sp. IB215316]MDX8363258.1 spore protease YyaC [Cytobacillus sp. IB215316]